MMKKTTLMLGSLLLSGSLFAQWQMIDDFESYTAGTELDPDHSNVATGDWNFYRSDDANYATIPMWGPVADPGDGSQGLVLELDPGVPSETLGGNTTIERAVPTSAQIVDPFPATTKATFYFKYYRPLVDGSPAESDTTWGMVAESARNETTGIHAYGSYSVLGRTEIDGIIDIRDGGTYTNLTTSALQTNTWYEFWFVVDHGVNTFTQYIKGGTDFPEITQLPAGSPINAAYRNATVDPLETILFITTTGGADDRKGKDPIYIDDIYIDPSAENLTTPSGEGGANDDGVNVKFVNIATRGLVGANAGEELIGGFVLLGENPQQVLIRGLGPDLADRGVAGVLADPKIEVRNFAGELVAENDNWGNATANADVAAAITAASSDPAAALEDDSLDAAILVTLAPNDVYTVVVSSNVAGGSGVALVEVFEMDQ